MKKTILLTIIMNIFTNGCYGASTDSIFSNMQDDSQRFPDEKTFNYELFIDLSTTSALLKIRDGRNVIFDANTILRLAEKAKINTFYVEGNAMVRDPMNLGDGITIHFYNNTYSPQTRSEPSEEELVAFNDLEDYPEDDDGTEIFF